MNHPPEVLITIGRLPIRTYGVMLAIAIVAAYSWAERRATRAGISLNLTNDLFFWAVIGGILGARLGFVIQEFGYFEHHLAEIFAFRAGGLSFHGGLVGGLIAGLIVLNKRRVLNQFWLLADVAAAPLLLGAAIGRLGNWANQELYGYPTTLPWAISIDPAHRLPGYENFTTFHPTFAYEMLLNLIGLLILLWLEKINKQQATSKNTTQNSKPLFSIHHRLFTPGFSFLFTLAWYSLARFTTEIWRIGDRLLGLLSLAQLISFVLIVVVIGAVMHRQKSHSPSRIYHHLC